MNSLFCRIPSLTAVVTTALVTSHAYAASAASKTLPPNVPPSMLSQPNCGDCHTCANPTRQDDCLNACPRHTKAHTTSSHAAKEAPDSFVIDKLAEQYAGVNFNHKLHANMSEMGQGCAVCHHYSPPGRIPACETCHTKVANPTELRQPGLKGAYHRLCLQCHREWSHETDCKVCHQQPPAGAQPKSIKDNGDIMGQSHPVIPVPEKRVYDTPYKAGPVVTFYHKEHVELFGLKCTSCHRHENCSYCHDLKKTVAQKKTMEQVHAICSECHEKDNCSTCHDTKERPAFSHSTTGWPLNRYHTELDCRACHPTGKPIGKLMRDCSTCHAGWKTENFRHAVTGVQLDEIHSGFECTDCHVNRKFTKPPVCTNCHDDGRTSKTNPPGKRVERKPK